MTIKESVQRTEKAQVQVAAGKPARLVFIDYLRASLAILVVLHHVAGVYGASIPWYYYIDPPFKNPQAFLALLAFMVVNQSWFMGAFFLLAGYFIPGSFDRRGTGSFVKGKLIRLGIPFLFFTFVLNPVSLIGLYLDPAPRITEALTWKGFWQLYPEFISMGPVWFVAMLLVFSIGYAAWRMLSGKRSSSSMRESSPGYLGVGIFILALAGISYLWRMLIPIGKEVFGFPSLGYFPQYLGFFIIGIIAYRKNWFETLSGRIGAVGLLVALLAGVFLFPLACTGQLFSLELSSALENGMGGGHWQSAVYTLWDSIFAVGLTIGLITIFRRFVSGHGRFGRFLSQQSYAVFIIHIPIVVLITYLMRGIEMGSLFKFGLASVIVVPVCFAAAYIIRKIPFVSRVL